MNGILLIDKPAGWTSFDVVAKLRGATRQKKIGHGGTLDPMATGVLPIFLGKATRLADLLPDETKHYEAEMQLGLVTDTYDTTGAVMSRRPVVVTDTALQVAAAQFVGDIMQLPPMYSAVKVGGRKLYDLARQGCEVERPIRPVHVHSLTATLTAPDKVALSVRCSKGTYVRSICHDMGALLSCGGAMSALRRTASAGFSLTDCLPLEQAVKMAESGEIADTLLSLSSALASLPALTPGEWEARLMLTGVRLEAERIGAQPGQKYRILQDDVFIGIGELNAEGLFLFKNLAI